MSSCQCVGLRSAARADINKKQPPIASSSSSSSKFKFHHRRRRRRHTNRKKKFVVLFVDHSLPPTNTTTTTDNHLCHYHHHHLCPLSSSIIGGCCHRNENAVIADHSLSHRRVPPQFVVDGHCCCSPSFTYHHHHRWKQNSQQICPPPPSVHDLGPTSATTAALDASCQFGGPTIFEKATTATSIAATADEGGASESANGNVLAVPSTAKRRRRRSQRHKHRNFIVADDAVVPDHCLSPSSAAIMRSSPPASQPLLKCRKRRCAATAIDVVVTGDGGPAVDGPPPPALRPLRRVLRRSRRRLPLFPFMLMVLCSLLFHWPAHVVHGHQPRQQTAVVVEDFSLHPAPRQARRVYTNQWAVRIEGGQHAQAEAIASKYGFHNLGPIIPGGDYFLFESRVIKKRSLRKVRRHLHHPTIGREHNVLWLQQQVVKKRVKRDFLRPSSAIVAHRQRPQRRHQSSTSSASSSVDDDGDSDGDSSQQSSPTMSSSVATKTAVVLATASDGGDGGWSNASDAASAATALRLRARHHTMLLQRQQLQLQRQHHHQQRQQHLRQQQQQLQHRHPFRPPVIQNSDDDYDAEAEATGDGGPDDFLNMNRITHNDQHRTQWARLRYGVPNDPYWKDLWYLHRRDEQPDEMDHNVKEAWYLGYTGKGIVVTILDDGLERTHPDIGPNYDPDASYDVNDRDEDPTPRYEYTDENRHGTRCAGEVASIFNNSLCIVGIAFNARIGGIRMLDGDVTDAVEATSLSHNSQHIDIYSASWGPDDDGRTVDGPATLTRSAFERGITEGRQGKGSIFIWASGNGGKDADSCNCDGYTNSIHTLSISSATERGAIPWYSEACSSTLATAYSSGSSGERMIVTTDLHHSCTKSHTGTSASAPLAAGIAALTLEANPNLGWRDLQHIVVRTAKPVNLRAGDWRLNGVGRNVSHSFGYGLLDAGAMVRLAKVWHNVPKQRKCRATYPNPYKTIPHGNRLHLQVYTDGCADRREQQVKYLEHVQAIVTLSAPKRGDIQIYLTSPRGTRSTLLAKRQRDTSRTGFKEWAFMTTHNWGESAYGTWSLEIDNDGNDDAELHKWELVLHGTEVYVGPTGFEPTAAVAERSVQHQQQQTNGAGGGRHVGNAAADAGDDAVPLSSSSSLFGLDSDNDGGGGGDDSNGTGTTFVIVSPSLLLLMALALVAFGVSRETAA